MISPKDFWFFLWENDIRDQYPDARCSHSYLDVFVSWPIQWYYFLFSHSALSVSYVMLLITLSLKHTLLLISVTWFFLGTLSFCICSWFFFLAHFFSVMPQFFSTKCVYQFLLTILTDLSNIHALNSHLCIHIYGVICHHLIALSGKVDS